MNFVDNRHRELQERVDAGELLSDREDWILHEYISGQRIAEFQKFSKIPRLNREIIITEKIDGTNAQLLITGDGRVIPGSRKRYLINGYDNYGFVAWVAEHENELRELGPGRHFGEWWGQGIQRGYGLDHKRFSLFNVNRWTSDEFELALPYCTLVPECCHVVPVLWCGLFRIDCMNNVMDHLRHFGSKAAPGFKQPEGIVIYHTAGNCLFKVTLENDEKPKGKNNA